MPYIITTYTGPLLDPVGSGQEPDTRTAVATVEEAQEEAGFQVEATSPDNLWAIADESEQARTLPEDGGTVGPLPDGTVIEVERVGWTTLRSMSGLDDAPNVPGSRPDGDILAAYNRTAA